MKIGIIGSGFVGGVGREIVLVDNNADRAEAEADDIRRLSESAMIIRRALDELEI
jgi:hypothetical protein